MCFGAILSREKKDFRPYPLTLTSDLATFLNFSVLYTGGGRNWLIWTDLNMLYVTSSVQEDVFLRFFIPIKKIVISDSICENSICVQLIRYKSNSLFLIGRGYKQTSISDVNLSRQNFAGL